jgi:hypothetical protein
MSPSAVEVLPRWIIRILHSGKILDERILEQDDQKVLGPKHIGVVMRAWFQRIADANDELVIDTGGPGLARTSFKDT